MGLLPRQRGSASQQIAETLGTVDFLLESPGGVSGDVAVVQLLSCVRLFETPIDYTVHGILQVRILEWIAISFSRESSQTLCLHQGLLHCRWSLYHLSHFCVSCWLGRVFMLRGLSPFAVMVGRLLSSRGAQASLVGEHRP